MEGKTEVIKMLVYYIKRLFGLTREFHYLGPANINSFCQIYAKGTHKMRVKSELVWGSGFYVHLYTDAKRFCLHILDIPRIEKEVMD